MRIFALVGPSGTGKSHLATFVAQQKGIECIIDDGLLIKGNRVLAGRSAKRERTKMAATRRAIFFDPEHAQQTREALRRENPAKILILATSEKMVQAIINALELPEPEEIINIKDISSEENIKKAKEMREKENSHVIPLPTFAIKKDFPGFLLDPILSFFGKGQQNLSSRALEHSIVRPMYSHLGNYYLSENVITDIVTYLATSRSQIKHIFNSQVTINSYGIIIDIELSLLYGCKIKDELKELQRLVKEKIKYFTGFDVLQVNATVKKIEVPQDRKKVDS